MSATRAQGFRYFSDPFLLGGDIDLQPKPLAEAHLSQTDTSCNGWLWGIFSVEDDTGWEELRYIQLAKEGL